MARRLKPAMEEQVPVNASNSKAIIREVAAKLIRLEARKKEILEEMSAVRADVKGIMKMADFNAALRLYKLEGDERSTALDSLRLAFEALDLGSQGSLFPDAEDDAEEPKAEMTPSQARAAGKRAGKAGKSAMDNPFTERHALNPTWNEGWLEGQRQIAESMRPGNGQAEGAAVQ